MAAWRVELAALGGRDTLLGFQDVSDGVLDLATAHPSGLATFLAGRSTRLSSLFREPGALAAARRSARSVRATASRLTDEHGLPGSHLAVGMLTRPGADGSSPVAAPVLLAPVSLTPRASTHADQDVALQGPVRLNPSLVRLLGSLGVDVDAAGLLALATGEHGFTPRPALHRLRDLTADLPGVAVVDRTVIGTFVDLGAGLVDALDEVAAQMSGHPVVRALVCGGGQRPGEAADRPAGAAWAPTSAQVTALPLDPVQRSAVDAVRSGAGVAVLAPAGTGATQVTAQIVAAAADADRSVLVVVPRRTELDDLLARLVDAGLGALAAVPTAAEAAPDAASPDAASPGDVRAALRTAEDLQVQVLAARRAVHEVREPWRTSKLEVLRSVREPQPEPGARPLLPPVALARLAGDHRARAAGVLLAALELGVGLPEASRTPWSGADLDSDEGAATALAAVRRLIRETLPRARAEMTRIATEAGLAGAGCVADWGRQLDLLVAVRDTLDVFVPTVYERPVDAMVAATATSGWRARHGIAMPALRRRAWRRQARELLRPGSRPRDLHAALARVQAERTAWQAISTGGGWPRVPAGLATADEAYQRVLADLFLLEPVLAGSRVGGGLADLSLTALAERLGALDGDAATLADLPRRAAVHAELAGLGLLDVLAHLRSALGTPTTLAHVGAELDELWFRAVLEAMDAQDDGLSADAEALRRAWDGVRAAQAAALRHRELGRSRTTATLVTALALPHQLSGADRFDLVVLTEAHALGLAEASLALVRAPQVVVVGDPHGPRPTRREPGAPEDDSAPLEPRDSLLAAAAESLAVVPLTRHHRRSRELVALADSVARAEAPAPPPPDTGWSVPAAHPDRVARLDVVPDGVVPATATAAASAGDVPGPDAEVARVVDLVLTHVRRQPQESLAVVALGRAHARRVADALRVELTEHPDLTGWFTGGARAPFVVTDLAHAEAAVRDHVVLTLGMGLTAHRRVLHRFGRLDGPDGDRLLRQALTRALSRVTVVSSITAEQLDPHRTSTPGARGLLALLSRLPAPDPDPAPARPVEQAVDPVLARLVAALADRDVPAAAPAGAPACTPDLAVDAPSGRVAVLWDGRPPTEVDQGVLVEEELLEAALRRAGWRVARVSARAVVADPGAVAAEVLASR